MNKHKYVNRILRFTHFLKIDQPSIESVEIVLVYVSHDNSARTTPHKTSLGATSANQTSIYLSHTVTQRNEISNLVHGEYETFVPQ